jgi:hypothetical protein
MQTLLCCFLATFQGSRPKACCSQHLVLHLALFSLTFWHKCLYFYRRFYLFESFFCFFFLHVAKGLSVLSLYIYVCIYIYIFFNCCAGDTLWHLLKFLQCIKYLILEFSPTTILLYHPSPLYLVLMSGHKGILYDLDKPFCSSIVFPTIRELMKWIHFLS